MKFFIILMLSTLFFLGCTDNDSKKDVEKKITKNPYELPLLSSEDLNSAFIGGFKLAAYNQRDINVPETHGWTAVYTLGPIAISEDGKKLFFGGYNGSYDGSTYDSIAQTNIPEFVIPSDFSDLSDLNETQEQLLQPWRSILELPNYSDKGGNTTLTSILAENGSLYIQAMKEYDNTNVTDSLMRINNASDIANTSIDGWYQVLPNGDTEKSAHAVNWLSPIPNEWQDILGASHLFGGGQTFSIINRLPVGPTLSVKSLSDLPESSGLVDTKVIMDFDLKEGEIFGQRSLSDWRKYYQYNCDPAVNHDCNAGAYGDYDLIVPGENDLWTLASSAYVGFIVPGTRTYAVIGRSGMHKSGGGYKLTYPDGVVCSGPCAKDPDDYYNYYWFFDLTTVLKAEDIHSLMPYAYGEIEALKDLKNVHGKKAIMTNAHYDIRTGKLLVLMPNMHGSPCCETKAAIFGFQLNSESIK